jgi:Ca2+-binding RTX toxin-like protein
VVATIPADSAHTAANVGNKFCTRIDGLVAYSWTPQVSSPFAVLRGGKLTVSGTSGDDSIVFQLSGTALKVKRCGESLAFKYSSVSQIAVSALDGNDKVIIGRGIRGATVHGGSGNDSLFGGQGNDRLYGDGGSDSIEGRGGSDRLYGGSGNDLILGGDQNDTIYGESGDDTIDAGNGDDRIYAGAGDDSILGGPGNDIATADASDILKSISKRR